ncbi:MAG TPA: hypothetical protein VID95_09095 [Candidatus Limnocylindrales bacterium]
MAPAAKPTSPAEARLPDALNALLAVGRSGAKDLEVIEATSGHSFLRLPAGAPDASWGHVLSTSTAGGSTTVRTLVVEETADARELRIDGDWQLPTVGLDPVPAGRSADGSTFVLVQPRTDPYATSATPSRFAIIHAPVPPAVGTLELGRIIEVPGHFDFDALSPDGSVLYVVEHLDVAAGGAYQVRSIDTATGRMDAVPIADKRNIDEAIAGRPITQLRTDGGMVYTLYRGAEHPFVHALTSTDKWALCIDLPAAGQADADAASDWALTSLPGSRSVFAVNATLGLVAEIDPSDLSIRRQATLPAAPVSASGPRIVLAKFGNEPGGPLGRRAAVTPDGGTIVAGGRDGLLGVAAKDLSVAWRALPGEAIRGVGLAQHGPTAYVLLGSGRIVAVSTVDGSVLGSVPGTGYDRLVAVLGG